MVPFAFVDIQECVDGPVPLLGIRFVNATNVQEIVRFGAVVVINGVTSHLFPIVQRIGNDKVVIEVISTGCFGGQRISDGLPLFNIGNGNVSYKTGGS